MFLLNMSNNMKNKMDWKVLTSHMTIPLLYQLFTENHTDIL